MSIVALDTVPEASGKNEIDVTAPPVARSIFAASAPPGVLLPETISL